MTYPNELRDQLRQLPLGDEPVWPADLVYRLRTAGCFKHAIRRRFGGFEAPPAERLAVYETVAAGSLTAALILTQHDAACELLDECENRPLAEHWLPILAGGASFATVGISQLTTSQQHAGPALRARSQKNEFILDGVMPWVTAAGHADLIITGAVLDDGRQILAAVRRDAPGIAVGPPIRLMALSAGCTSEVRCKGLMVTPADRMRGPVEKALTRRAPTKSLTVSAVGLGVAAALLDAVRARSAALPESDELVESVMAPALSSVRSRLYAAAADTLGDATVEHSSADLRSEVNALVARLAVTLGTLLKGRGYVAGHPEQRLVREAFLFPIWSAPAGVQMGTLRRIWT